ncbi:MAG: hypothetical protein HY760_00445 [Nitrospirae bacterium]|nr:hypothetical protein [Nitrospirota bacterium]
MARGGSLLRSVVEAVEKTYQDGELPTLPPHKKAELITTLYEALLIIRGRMAEENDRLIESLKGD